MTGDLVLCVPSHDVADPEISIVIPALNEEITIADFVDWCHIGLARAGVRGEILIVDSSSDTTAAIALDHGARVLRAPKRGLGRAYIDAIPYVRGQYVLMGDADCTYDFREMSAFVEAFRAGHEFVMGSRFRGYIEPASMPPLHRYFGTPVTVKGGVKPDHWGGEKVDHFAGGRCFGLKDLRGRLERRPATRLAGRV